MSSKKKTKVVHLQVHQGGGGPPAPWHAEIGDILRRELRLQADSGYTEVFVIGVRRHPTSTNKKRRDVLDILEFCSDDIRAVGIFHRVVAWFTHRH